MNIAAEEDGDDGDTEVAKLKALTEKKKGGDQAKDKSKSH